MAAAFLRIAVTFIDDVRRGDRYALKALWSIVGVIVACILIVFGVSLGGCASPPTASSEKPELPPGIIRDTVIGGGLLDSLTAAPQSGPFGRDSARAHAGLGGIS